MIKFFRKIRQKLINQNRIRKYLFYAIGEIVLVVIGILIALSINNWNESRKSEEYIKSVYKQIHKELVADTLNIYQSRLEFIKTKNRIQNILDGKVEKTFYDTINNSNYKNCKICGIDVVMLFTNKLSLKGYKLLSNINTEMNVQNDSLPIIIEDFYSNFIEIFELDNRTIETLAIENFKDFEDYSWYTDWIEGKYNAELLSYIFENESYKKKLTTYKLYVMIFQLNNVTNFMKEARYILPLISKQIE